jgi:hypothetical protein
VPLESLEEQEQPATKHQQQRFDDRTHDTYLAAFFFGVGAGTKMIGPDSMT